MDPGMSEDGVWSDEAVIDCGFELGKSFVA
jgi:hypothetical protein